MEKICEKCGQQFEIAQGEQKFYKKMKVMLPDFCPNCREQRRLAFRNEMSLYQSKCSLCGNKIISMYDPQSGYKVFCHECYFGDKWNAIDYGRDIDFNKPFFEQFKNLYDDVPKLNLYVKMCENCKFNNIILHNKNCYLIFGSGFSEDCYYSTHIFYSENCCDMFFSEKCTECYQLVDCNKCYRTMYSQLAENCKDSYFLFDCKRCENCIGCSNLRDKKYHIFNKKVSKENFEKYKQAELKEILGNFDKGAELLAKISKKAIHKYMISEKSENVTGDMIYNSKNAVNSYNIYGSQDVYNLSMCLEQKDSGDAIGTSLGELAYDCLNNDYAQFTRFCLNSTYLNECDYCDSCDNCRNLFGCVGLRHKDHFILNKEYKKEDYEKLVGRIIEIMKNGDEFGRFFPIQLSPFAYNETVAQEYYLIDKGEAEKNGWRWRDKVVRVEDSASVSDEVCACDKCGKSYRLIKQELMLYRRIGIPLPKRCPDCRHLWRLSLRSPRKLWDRKCGKCGFKIETAYAPGKVEKVYCEKCYLENIC